MGLSTSLFKSNFSRALNKIGGMPRKEREAKGNEKLQWQGFQDFIEVVLSRRLSCLSALNLEIGNLPT